VRLFIEHIKETDLQLDGEEPVEMLNDRFSVLSGTDITFLTPLHYRLRAVKIGSIVEVEGELQTSLQLCCSRCLKEFPLPLEARFEVAFDRDDGSLLVADEEEGLELSGEELGLSTYSGDEIDLHETLDEQILLALPAQPLCGQGCKGLCPRCGADLNDSPCQCSAEIFNSKFAGLKDFKVGE